jgi:hypothetical protein
MTKQLKILLLVFLGLVCCKNKNNENSTSSTKQDDLKYFLKKEENDKSFDFTRIKGKWELKKVSNENSDNSEISSFELLSSEIILGNENCDASFEIDTIHSLEYYIEGHFSNHTLKDEMRGLEKKIYDLFKINLNTFKGVITTKCSPPFNKLYVFEDNLLVWYDGNYMQYIKKNEKFQQLLFKCKENDNGKSRYDDPLNKICVCNETMFNSAYEIFYNNSADYLKKDLVEKLPLKDFKRQSNDAEVSYRWILNDTLKIDMIFEGGENHYIFYKNSHNKIEYKEYLFLP